MRAAMAAIRSGLPSSIHSNPITFFDPNSFYTIGRPNDRRLLDRYTLYNQGAEPRVKSEVDQYKANNA
jgi:hypothetical protein